MSEFDEVISDIIEKIDILKYDNVKKNIIKSNIMLNLLFFCKDETTFEKNVYILKKGYAQKNDKSID